MTRLLAAAGCALLLTGCVTALESSSGAETVTLAVDGVVDAAQTSQPNYYRLALPPDLPADVVADFRQQLMPLLGREDFVAADNDEYTASACAPASPTVAGAALLDLIAARAATTSIVIINESHVVSRHRHLIEDLLVRLKPLGYTVYAAETFANRDGGPQPVEAGAALPYARFGDGHYSAEAQFGRVIRTAKRLGYRLVPYEMADTARSGDHAAAVTARETAQAENLRAVIAGAPSGTKIIVHVGYSHASEQPVGGADWMALRLKRATGIDPLTIGQTDCRGGGAEPRLVAAGVKTRTGTFDLAIDHPLTTFVRHRPAWRFAAGDRAVEIPAALRPATGAVVVEARLEGEPETAIPVDRVYVRAGEDVVLALPPGRYRVRAVRTEI